MAARAGAQFRIAENRASGDLIFVIEVERNEQFSTRHPLWPADDI